MSLRAALTCLVLVLLVPSAAASCYLPPPADLSRVAWAGNDRVVTTINGAWGLHNWRDGQFQPFANPGPDNMVVSPDGAWAAWVEDAGRTDACARVGPALVAAPVQGAPPQAVRAGDVRALAASVSHLAVVVPDDDAILLYRWGEWHEPTRLEVKLAPVHERPEGVVHAEDRWSTRQVGMMRFSPDGARLAIATENGTREGATVVLVDVDTGEPLDSGQSYENSLYDMAFDPSGERLAVALGQHDKLTDLRVRDVGDEGATTARWLDVRAPGPLAWSRFGLALAQTEHGLTGGGALNGSLAVFPDATLTGGARVDIPGFPVQDLRWTNDGELVVGLEGRLRVYNASLGFQGGSTPGAAFLPATPPPTPVEEDHEDALVPLTPWLVVVALAAVALVARRG